MGLEQIVNVNISRTTQTVSRAGFGTPMILGETVHFSDRIHFYNTPADVLSDGFISSDPEYLAAVSLYSQALKPKQFAIGKRLIVSMTPEPITTAMDAISQENDNFYGVMQISRVKQDILDMASYLETKPKLFVACSADVDVLTGANTDVAFALKSSAYARSSVLYSGDAGHFPDAAWLGGLLPFDPGSETWKFKKLVGTTPDNLTPTQSAFVKGKNANTYTTVGGQNITAEGTVAVGEFIDVIRFSDWLKARIQERVYARLVQLPKIPFTDGGIGIIEAEVRAQLAEGERIGGLVKGSSIVTAPLAASISSVEKGLRELNGVTFSAVLAGAIHSLTINGFVSV